MNQENDSEQQAPSIENHGSFPLQRFVKCHFCGGTNWTLTEKGAWYTSHFYQNGELWHDNKEGDYSTWIKYFCMDCKIEKEYKTKKSWPKNIKFKFGLVTESGT